jgi:SAM-dependent methyltransferase
MENGEFVQPSISPLEFKREVIINILSEKIEKLHIKSVLEIGSGAGLNLLFLAPLFPDVKFYGIEPTDSGVRVSNNFLNNPPKEFEEAHKQGSIENVRIIKGSILNLADLESLKDQKVDLVFSCAVLEQLNNYIEEAFGNIFQLDCKYFLFYEEWLEANSTILNYKTLVDADYFRLSLNYLNKFPIGEIKFEIPTIQPSWLSYGIVFGEKMFNSQNV